MGHWVDHPEIPVPDSNICNWYAEQYTKKLKAQGYPVYYIYGNAPNGEGHIMVGFDTAGGTIVWDNLHAGLPVSVDQLFKEGYLLISVDIDGNWYYINGQNL